MPLLYPIAPNARAALDAEGGARTIAEARELANGPVTLVADWLRPQPGEHEELQGKAESGISRGFVQVYEDAKGKPVIAVTYWKPGAEKPAPQPRSQPAAAPDEPPEDHTDDLYFTKAEAKAKRKRKAIDPNQLDLFGRGKKNATDADSPGPGGVIVDEDGHAGDGAAQEEST